MLLFFRKEGLPFTLLLIAASVYFFTCFASIPVNTEARDYIFQAGGPGSHAHLSTLLFPTGSNVRVVSMLVFGATRRACGFSSRCLNTIQILQLLAALAAAAWHLQQLIRRPGFVAIAMLFWCVSLPVFQAGFWQATQHDKLAFAFSMVALAIGFRAIRADTPGGIVRGNLLLTLLFALAFNAKEAAFFLPGAALVQIWLFARERNFPGRLRAATVYLLPLVYAVAYAGIYASRLQGYWKMHVLSGDPFTNAVFYMGSVLGGHAPLTVALGGSAAMLLGACVMGCRGCAGDVLAGRAGAYLLAVGLGSTALVLPAQVPGDYYMLIGEWSFVGLVAAMLARAAACSRPLHLAILGLSGLLAGVFVQGRATDFASPTGGWAMLREAQRLGRGYRTIRRTCAPQAPGGMKLVFPADPIGKWYYFRGGDEAPDQLVGAFICQDGQRPQMSYSFDGNARPDRPGELVVVWTRQTKIDHIRRSGIELYSP